MAFLCRDIARLQTDLHIDGTYSSYGWRGSFVAGWRRERLILPTGLHECRADKRSAIRQNYQAI